MGSTSCRWDGGSASGCCLVERAHPGVMGNTWDRWLPGNAAVEKPPHRPGRRRSDALDAWTTDESAPGTSYRQLSVPLPLLWLLRWHPLLRLLPRLRLLPGLRLLPLLRVRLPWLRWPWAWATTTPAWRRRRRWWRWWRRLASALPASRLARIRRGRRRWVAAPVDHQRPARIDQVRVSNPVPLLQLPYRHPVAPRDARESVAVANAVVSRRTTCRRGIGRCLFRGSGCCRRQAKAQYHDDEDDGAKSAPDRSTHTPLLSMQT